MQSFNHNANANANANAMAGPSQPRKPRTPFVSAEHRPEHHDGRFRVVLITSGSVASVKMPDIVGALSRVNQRFLSPLRMHRAKENQLHWNC
jgi:phosphopantothenoylcysteine decarboxylase